MEQNNRRNRYQDDNRTSNYNRRNNEYDRDKNYTEWDKNYNNRNRSSNDINNDFRGYNNRNRNVYSSDRERDYWNDRNEQMNDLSNDDRSYNRPNSSYMNNDYNGYRYGNDYYNNKYRNEGWRDNYQNEDRDWWDKTKDEVSSWFGDDDARRRRRMDDVREGEHRGKGPKNYSRSTERIKEDASDRLSDDPLIDASDIEIEVKDNELTLSGTVDTRYEKRRAEDLVESVSGVANVQNNLRVASKNALNTTTNLNTTSGSTYSANSNRKESAI